MSMFMSFSCGLHVARCMAGGFVGVVRHACGSGFPQSHIKLIVPSRRAVRPDTIRNGVLVDKMSSLLASPW